MTQTSTLATDANVGTGDSRTKVIYCVRSGLPLASVTTLCNKGWPIFSSLQDGMLHPDYSTSLESLISRLTAQVKLAESKEWEVTKAMQTDMQVCMSAIMYGLDAMWLPPEGSSHKIEPSLPRWSVVVGSAAVFTKLARWYHYSTSKRLHLPIYRVTKTANNPGWESFSGWMEEAFSVKKVWEKGRINNELVEAAEQRRQDAIEEISADKLYKRMDFKKIWNWVDIQLADHPQYGKEYPVGRRETFKELFLTGDLHVENWTVDDVEDLQFAIAQCCELGNDISYFINTRLNSIKECIRDFFSAFTIVGRNIGIDAAHVPEKEKEATAQFFEGFDKRASMLEELPAAPKREDFPNAWTFLKAQAEHNILAKRFSRQAHLAQDNQTAAAQPTIKDL